jgi:hypothetical protein
MATGYEVRYYADVSSIAESLRKIEQHLHLIAGVLSQQSPALVTDEPGKVTKLTGPRSVSHPGDWLVERADWRRPYVGDGADGCRRSAQIDREEADTHTIGSPPHLERLASAKRWERQAEQMEGDER